jgi:hypothetical protein
MAFCARSVARRGWPPLGRRGARQNRHSKAAYGDPYFVQNYARARLDGRHSTAEARQILSARLSGALSMRQRKTEA